MSAFGEWLATTRDITRNTMNRHPNIFGGTVEDVQEEAGNAIEESQQPPNPLDADDINAEGNLQEYQNKRQKNEGRLAANINKGTGASILTSG